MSRYVIRHEGEEKFVEGYDHASAAADWIERREQDDAEYPVGNGDRTETVEVRADDEDRWYAFKLTGHLAFHYFADAVGDAPPERDMIP